MHIAADHRNWRVARRGSFAAVLARLFLRILQRVSGPLPSDGLALVAQLRARYEQALRWFPKPDPATVCVEAHTARYRAYWMHAQALRSDHVLLYLHGGGYIMGSPHRTHRDLINRLSAAAQAKVFAVDYSKAPEVPFPAALDEVLAAYEDLLTEYPASAIAVGGDSAGGGLTLAMVQKLCAAGRPVPAAIFAMSPCTDLTGSGASVVANAQRDFVIPAETIGTVGALYLGQAAADDPGASPLFGDFRGFPPTLLQVGSEEVFLDDSTRVADKLRAAGVPVLLDIWPRQPHVWQALAGFVPEARAAIADVGRFLRSHLRNERTDAAGVLHHAA